MPLIVLCGLPAAGKTLVATALIKYIQDRCSLPIRYITEANVNRARTDAYKDAFNEKVTRCALRSAVEKQVEKNTIVVLDALNYIKGMRYELYCKAREESTTYCLIYVDTSLEVALQRNQKRKDSFDPNIISEIAARFELPNEKNRWDSPLIHVKMDRELYGMDLESNGMDREWNDEMCAILQLENVYKYVTLGECVKAGMATIAPVKAPSDFLANLDNETRQILEKIVEYQRQNSALDPIHFRAHHGSGSLVLQPGRKVSMAELQRHRRQFIKLLESQSHSKEEICRLFVGFLQNQLD